MWCKSTISMRLSCFCFKSVLPLPDEWDPQPRDINGKEETLHLVSLDKESKEYKKIQEKFLQTMRGKVVIRNIERIQNPSMHNSYMVRKQTMDAKNGTMDNELELFHGTKVESIKAINVQGFDRSLCGAYGTYMKGSNDEHKYSHGIGRIFSLLRTHAFKTASRSKPIPRVEMNFKTARSKHLRTSVDR